MQEVEVLVLTKNELVPVGLHEQLIQRFENSDLKVKFIFALDFQSVPVLPEIWIVESFLFLSNKPSKEILSKAKWIQQVYAGVDLLNDYFKTIYSESEDLPFIFTRMGAIGRAMSEWTIGQIIAQERYFYHYYNNISERVYERIYTFRSLNELTIGIIGYGDIGRDLAKRAKNGFEMKILAFKRNVPESDEYVDKFYTKLEDMLPECDYIVNILPSTALTRNLITKEIIECCNKNKKTVFVNIGRGDVMKTETLLYALDNQYFAHAILDVFEVEPLPKDSDLWNRKNVLISPHISACIFAWQVVDLFEKNISLYLAGEKLQFSVSYRDEY